MVRIYKNLKSEDKLLQVLNSSLSRFIAGVDSLLEQDVSDEPLLMLAREKSDVLTYVHLVKDSVPITLEEGDDEASDSCSVEELASKEDNWDCFDEDSEVEFEG